MPPRPPIAPPGAPVGHSLFETPLGTCGIAWSERGITAVAFPERNAAATARRLAAPRSSVARALVSEAELPVPEASSRPPPFARAAMKRITKHLEGKPQRFEDLPLDTGRVPSFHARVYAAARAVASGETVTYGELAERVGSPGAARAVGQAMAQNPFPIVVPCHRVLAASGRIGGFSAPGGLATKRRLLELEKRGR